MASQAQESSSSSPTSNIPKLKYIEGFTFLFNDPNWANNLLIGSVFVLIPIIGPIVLVGWFCEIIQRLVRRNSHPIPKLDFSDFMHYLQRGIIPFVVGLIISLPFALIISIVSSIIMFAFIPFLSQETSPAFFLVFFGGVFIATILTLIPMMIISNAAYTRAYLTEDFGQSLKVKKILNYAKLTWGTLLKGYFGYLPLVYLIMLIGMMLLYIGIFPAMLIGYTAMIYLCWQIYEIYLAKGGEPIPLKSIQQVLPEAAPTTK